MKRLRILLLALAIIACAFAWGRTKRAGFRSLTGSQKVFAVIAVLLAILIVINPEIAAFGLLGDSAFFDLLVLALSLQMQVFVARAWSWLSSVLVGSARWLITPSPGLRYLVATSTFVIGAMVSMVQKAVHRIFS
jgi:hypothetical protein